MKKDSPLANRRSPRWAWMERFEVPDYDTDGNYLVRLRLVQTPWFGIYVHTFFGPDPRDTLHDHPWNFISLVLRGGYIERRLDPHTMEVNERHVVRRFNRIRRGEAHAITTLLGQPTVTLMIVGRRLGTWGYWEPVHGVGREETWRWTEFNKHLHAWEFDQAMARRGKVNVIG